MVQVKGYLLKPVFLTLILTGASLFFMLLSVPKVQSAPAAGNRPPYNASEVRARDECATQGWDSIRYGTIWFTNDVSSYYAGSVNVGAQDNTITVFIRGSMYGCHSTLTNNTYAVAVSPQNPNGWRLSALNPTSFFRGNSQGTHNWSTQGGDITTTLDVADLARNNAGRTDTVTIDVGLYRCFSTNPSSPTGSCGTEIVPVTVTRAPRPIAPTLSPTCTNGFPHRRRKLEQFWCGHA